MDPIYRHTEFNSENFNWMARMAGVFWSHELGDREKQRYRCRTLRSPANSAAASPSRRR